MKTPTKSAKHTPRVSVLMPAYNVEQYRWLYLIGIPVIKIKTYNLCRHKYYLFGFLPLALIVSGNLYLFGFIKIGKIY